MKRSVIRSGCSALVLGLTAAVFTALPAPTLAVSEGPQGASLLRDVQRGARSCGQLTEDQFAAVGEYVMSRMIGSPRAHESMDDYMAQMMGPGSERLMHAYMGRRMTGCGGSAMHGAVGGAVGMMGAGMMGAGAFGPYGGERGAFAQVPGAMMAVPAADRDDGDDDAPVGWMITMVVVLIGAAAAAVYLVRRSGRRRIDPSDLLALRLARGEIDIDEYQRRRGLLRGAG